MRRWAVCAGALLASACAFSSEAPYFADSEGTFPFADGARFTWREDRGDGIQSVRYEREAGVYAIYSADEPDDPPLRVLFVPITETPELDFIAQVRMPNAPEHALYAFVWREDGGDRIITAPSAMEDAPGAEEALESVCGARNGGECGVRSREALLSLYRDVIYPAFVAGDMQPTSYIEQTPARGAGTK